MPTSRERLGTQVSRLREPPATRRALVVGLSVVVLFSGVSAALGHHIVSSAGGGLASRGMGSAIAVAAPHPSAAPSLTNYWPANGNANDVVGGNDGTLVNGSDYAPGVKGQAFSFDGANQFVRALGPVPLGASNFSIDLWARWASVTSGTFIADDNGSGCHDKWFFAWNSGDLLFHINRPGCVGEGFFAEYPFTPNSNQWYNFAVTRSGGLITIYVGCSPVSSQATAPASVSFPTAPLTIGFGEVASGYFDGRIDDVRVYAGALSAPGLASLCLLSPLAVSSTLVLANNSLVPGNYLPANPAGNTPYALAYDSARHEIFVANAAPTPILDVVSDATNHIVSAIPGVNFEQMAYDSLRGEIFGLSWANNSLGVVSDSTDAVTAWVPLPGSVFSLAYDSGQGELFVTEAGSGTVLVVSDSSYAVLDTLHLGGEPYGVTYDPSTGDVYVVNHAGYPASWVNVIDDATNTPVANVTVGADPTYPTYDSITGEVYVGDGPAMPTDDVSAINTTSYAVTTIPAGDSPVEGAFAPGFGSVFIADNCLVFSYSPDACNGYVSMISSPGNSLIAQIQVGSGAYSVAYDPNNGLVYIGNLGQGTVSIIGTSQFTPVTFREVGLPAGRVWFVNVSGEPPLSGDSSSISTALANGTYTYAVGSVNKRWQADGGTFVTNGTSLTVPVEFSEHSYTVSFTETGLPTKKLGKVGWSVALNGTLEHSRTNTISFTGIPNGSLPVLVTGPSRYAASGSGTVSVRGATSVGVTIVHSRTVTLAFHEKGLPNGRSWCASVDAFKVCQTAPTERFLNLTPGAYSYAAVLPAHNVTVSLHHTPVPTLGSISLSKNTKLTVTYLPTYRLEFQETGLSSGTWSVTVMGSTHSSAAGTPIYFTEGNGSYAYTVGKITGYHAVGAPPRAIVSGPGAKVTVSFTSRAAHSAEYSGLVAVSATPTCLPSSGARRAS